MENVESVYPLSPMQLEILLRSLRAPGRDEYVEQVAWAMEGGLDEDAFEGAWRSLAARHPALRAAFFWEGLESPVQVVQRSVEVRVERLDWRGVPAGEREARAAALARRERRPFALGAAPLFRVACARTGERSWRALWSFHHLLLDGWSSGLALREVFAVYEAARRGEAPALEPPRPFEAYVSWLRSRPEDGAEAFWRGALAGAAAPAPLFPGRPDPAGEPGLASAALPPALAERLREAARSRRLTLNTLFQGAWALLLGRRRGEREAVFGAVGAGRPPELPGADATLGVFLETVPVRAPLPPDAAVGAWLRDLQAAQLAARRHGGHPLRRIREWSGLPAGERLFDTLLVFQNLPFGGVEGARVAELEVRDLRRLPAATALGHALLLEVAVRGEVALHLGYDGSVCGADEAGRLLEQVRTLLEQVAGDPDRRLAELSLASAAERARVLEAWDAAPAAPPARCVHELLAEQAARTPGAPALAFRGETLTYAELDRRANRLARHLRGRGVGPETRVGVCLERTPELAVALLAVLKAGGAYVPLDPAHPPARLRAMVEDAEARLVLTTAALAGRLPGGVAEPVLLDALRERLAAESDAAPESGADPENLSHVVFTSGSTGRPRGVMVRHAAVSALLHWLRGAVTDGERSSALFATSVGFDVSVAELFGTLAWGGKAVLAESALELAALEEPVVLASMVPSAAAELLRAGGIPRSVRTLNLGGEPLPPELARALYALEHVEKVGNLYGPTEDTTYSAYALVPRDAGEVTVGRPVAGARAYVLDPEMQPLPDGAAGELYLAGDGLARGYAGRPGRTAERFLPCPFGPPGSRMYRVGDRVRRRPDGELEYLGRTDFQVKVRGFRVELGEVEAALLAHPAVGDAVVVLRDLPGGPALVAYVAPPADGGPGEGAAALRDWLRARLPEPMVPSAFVALEALPRTPHGKLDRAALPAPEAADGGAGDAPRGPTEEVLAGIFAELLGAERVGRGAGFFELGGHSLLAARAAGRVREALGVELPVPDFFEAPTVAGLAARVEALRAGGADPAPPPPVPVPRDRPLPLSFAQRRLWLLHQVAPASYNLAAALRLRGPLSAGALRGALEAVVARHEALRTRIEPAGGEPVQVVEPPRPFALPVTDLSALPAAEREAAVARRAAEEEARPFDLAEPPLLRAALLRLGAEEHVLLLALHHVAADGWSEAVLVRELGAHYAALAAGGAAALPPLPLQYGDYAVWQRGLAAGGALQGSLEFWSRALAGAPPALELPADRPRPPAQSFRGGTLRFRLDAPRADALRRLARREDCTLFMALLAGFGAWLHRYTGEDDLVVGTPLAGRDHPALEPLIGCFVNVLPVRVGVDGGGSFRDLLRRVRGALLEAYPHGGVSFDRIVEAAGVPRDAARAPLVQVLFALQNTPLERPELGGLAAEPLELPGTSSRYDLSLYLREEPDGALAGTAEYAAGLYDRATVDRWMRHYARLLDALAADPGLAVGDAEMLDAAERGQAVHGWNATDLPWDASATVPRLFEAQLRRTPDAVALVSPGERLTYAELDRRAAAVARRLAALGVAPETRVAILLERTAALVAAMLGVLKAGGAYVPLDPAHPAARLAWMLEDSGARVLVTEPGLRGRAAGFAGEVVEVGASLPPAPSPTRGEGEHDGEVAGVVASGGTPLPRPLPRKGGGEHTDAGRPLRDAPPPERGRVASLSEPGGGPPGGDPPAADNAAYVVYTSGSTGTPKGVVVTHANVASFFAAMRARVGAEPGTWLAVTSIGFDISVLEILWTLTQGSTVVLRGPEPRAGAAGDGRRAAGPTAFSLFYFAAGGGGSGRGKYRLLLEGARWADRNGFEAVWTPERHFHHFGGPYPNPSVTSAALATVTGRVRLRAGSVVLPLHDPLRVAEEWAVVDNLSDGRVELSFASGWHADDFVLARERYAGRREAMFAGVEEVRRLWRGEKVARVGGTGETVEVGTLPRPVQPELPVWITAAGSPDTFRRAGRIGAHLLTHLLGQSVAELAERVRAYREGRREGGHDPEAGRVALMLHTFVGDDADEVRETVRGPFREYLRSSFDLVLRLAEPGADAASLSADDVERLLDLAFERYHAGSALVGTPEACLETVRRVRAAGVDEVACLIDFGVDEDRVLASLDALRGVMEAANAPPAPREEATVAEQIRAHGVTHLQCTPSLAGMLAADPEALRAMGGLECILLGGETLPPPLAARLREATGARLLNLYGPTETTVWSTAHEVADAAGPVPIGAPVANARAYVVDARLRPVPPGVAGELLIGGPGVARGYLDRPELTAERFVPDPFSAEPGARAYRTGDRARRRADGVLEFLGRADRQLKVRGHRVEPGEVEAALDAHPGVLESAVAAVEDGPAGERRLAAYVVPRAPGARRLVPVADPDERERILAGLPRFTLPDGTVVAHQRDAVTRELWREVFEEETYLRHGIELEDGACVVDAGANVGMFTLFAHARARGVRSFSFEPIPDTFAVLRANAALFGLDARVFAAGLAGAEGTAEFTFYPDSSGLSGRYAHPERDRRSARSMIEAWARGSGDGGPAAAEVDAFLDERFRAVTFSCPLRTLSGVIREEGIGRIDLLKVDVERSEYDVLLGIEEEHWPRIRQVVMEVDTAGLLERVAALLERHGFEHLEDRHVTLREGAGDDPGEHVHMLYAKRPGDGAPLRRGASPGAAGRAAPTAAELRGWLAERLPEPMVPSLFTFLERMPRTPGGKTDRRALPRPGPAAAPETAYVEPRSALERTISEVWREVLGVERVGVRDNFFELGGTSIGLAAVHHELSRRLERPVTAVELFRHATVAALAEHLAAGDGAAPEGAPHAGLHDRAERQRRAREARQPRRTGRAGGPGR